MKKLMVVSLVLIGVLLVAPAAYGVDTVEWTDWTSASNPSPFVVGTASGTLGSLTVTYTGQIYPAAQVSGGTYLWLPATTFVSPLVTNPPTTADIIRLEGGPAAGISTIEFSAPVKDPVIAIRSLGQPNFKVSYDFDAPFDVLSYGPGSVWGGPGTLTELAGDVLEGEEGNGVIKFNGTFTSISWTSAPSEFWHGFTVGRILPTPVLIDIKPGSDPNSINISNEGNGVVPVAILGSESLDVTTIDPLSVKLEGAAVRLKGKSGTAGSICDVNADGYPDLVVHIADFTVAEGTATAKLTALTYGGVSLEGSDSIRLVPPVN